MGADGTFGILIERRSENTSTGAETDERLDLSGRYEQHAQFLILHGARGGTAFGTIFSNKIRIAFASLSSVEGLSTLQGDFYSDRAMTPPVGHALRDFSARLRRVNGDALPVQFYCHRDGCTYVVAGCISSDLYVDRVLIQMDISSAPQNSATGPCQSEGIARQARLAGPVLHIANPEYPDWPIFGHLKDSVLTFFRNSPVLPVFDGDAYEFVVER